MRKPFIKESNKIGTAILYLRESNQISQSKLSKGLCSVATLSRIETGEREADPLLVEALLERLGKTPYQFELILNEKDYILFHKREEIRSKINEKDYEEAYLLLNEYEAEAAEKGTVHLQFIIYCKAMLNELHGGSIEKTIELLMRAISCTVPDFKENKILDYYLSTSEMSIIIELVQRLITAGNIKRAKEILVQIVDYLEKIDSIEENCRYYPRVAMISSRLFMLDNELKRVIDMCDRGVEKHKGSRSMEFMGDLYLLKAQAVEGLLKETDNWSPSDSECLKLYLQAYHLLDACSEHDMADSIRKHLQEEYQWEDIE